MRENDVFRGENAVELKKLQVGYKGKVIIGDIDLGIRKGEIVTLIGPNGAGKSTLLKTISRQLMPVSGTVFIEGSELGRFNASELSKTLSVLLTERIDPELMTVRDVVESGRYPYTGHLGILEKKDREVVEEAIKLCDAESFSHRFFRELSDGQKQRVMLARALAQEPEILVLDEATSYMDIKYKLELLKLLKSLSDMRNMTIIMSLHEFELARVIADRIICTKNGSIFKIGKPEEILKREVLCELYDINKDNLEILLQALTLMI